LVKPPSPLGGTVSTPWSAKAVKLHDAVDPVAGAVVKSASAVVVPSGSRKR
jgi:hypothetical protein